MSRRNPPDLRPPVVCLHRFHDSASLAILRADSIYLDARAARTLAAALSRLARSLERESYADSKFKAEPVAGVATSGEAGAFPPSSKRFPRPRVVTFSAPESWAVYFINDDASPYEADELRAIRAFARTLPGPVAGCEPLGFMTYHDARDVFPFASDCATFSVLVYPKPKPKKSAGVQK